MKDFTETEVKEFADILHQLACLRDHNDEGCLYYRETKDNEDKEYWKGLSLTILRRLGHGYSENIRLLCEAISIVTILESKDNHFAKVVATLYEIRRPYTKYKNPTKFKI
jgi:hypothetical protein